MEIVTSQLSSKLCIEDIDAVDSDNPQLCAEYVKEIYDYIRILEVDQIKCALTCYNYAFLTFCREIFTFHPPS